jgi:hypothetical protein
MNRLAVVLVLLALAACKEKPKPPPVTPAARGAAFFAATAEKFGDLVVADLKATKEDWYKDYLKQTGAKDDAELQKKMQIGKGILEQYASSFALTEADETAMKDGVFADEENLKKVNLAATRLDGSGQPIPDAPRIALQKVRTGDWNKGVRLEFVARMLDGYIARAKR